MLTRQVLRNCRPQIPDTRRRRVMGCALLQPLDARTHDGFGGIEIGLTNFQMDDAATLPFQLSGPPQHLESSLTADALHPFRDPALRIQLHSVNPFRNETTSKYNIYAKHAGGTCG